MTNDHITDRQMYRLLCLHYQDREKLVCHFFYVNLNKLMMYHQDSNVQYLPSADRIPVNQSHKKLIVIEKFDLIGLLLIYLRKRKSR